MATHIPPRYRARADALKGRVVLVTGASSGLGRAASKTYAAHGATVVLSGRDVSKLEQLHDEIERDGSPGAFICPLDLSQADAAAFDALRDALDQHFGHLDGVLHSAATLGQRTPLEHFPLDAWATVMHVNLSAALALTQSVLPLMRRAKDASLLFTASGVGRRGGSAYWGAYGVSKCALEGLVQGLAEELEKTSSVRVNSLNPGAVNTAMRRAAFPAETPTDNPFPEQRMAAYLYLMGPDSVGVNGRQFDA